MGGCPGDLAANLHFGGGFGGDLRPPQAGNLPIWDIKTYGKQGFRRVFRTKPSNFLPAGASASISVKSTALLGNLAVPSPRPVEQIVERSVYSLLDNQYKFDLGIEHFSAVFMIGFGGETELRQTLKGDIESSHDLAEKLNCDKHGKVH